MKKLMMLSAALFAFNLTVFACIEPELAPDKECWSYGTPEVSVDPENPDCYIVTCGPPFDRCCIWLNNVGTYSIDIDGIDVSFNGGIDIVDPGNDLGQGASIIGYLN